MSPSLRSLRGRVGAHALHAKYDSREITAAARAASPGSVSYFEDQVDPDHQLTESERLRRAEHARRSYFYKLALRSAEARRDRKRGSA